MSISQEQKRALQVLQWPADTTSRAKTNAAEVWYVFFGLCGVSPAGQVGTASVVCLHVARQGTDRQQSTMRGSCAYVAAVWLDGSMVQDSGEK